MYPLFNKTGLSAKAQHAPAIGKTRCFLFKRLPLIVLFLLGAGFARAQATEIIFDIYYKDKIIGLVTALKIQNGNKITEDLHTKTDSKVLMLEVHVESEINTTFHKNILQKGIAYRRSNRGSEDIETTILKTDERSYTIERDQKKQILKTSAIDFCIVDLYFTEPVGKKNVFSNMYGQFITIIDEGGGTYKTLLPDGKKAIYTYEAGKLETIEVEMSLGKVVSKRRK